MIILAARAAPAPSPAGQRPHAVTWADTDLQDIRRPLCRRPHGWQARKNRCAVHYCPTLGTAPACTVREVLSAARIVLRTGGACEGSCGLNRYVAAAKMLTGAAVCPPISPWIAGLSHVALHRNHESMAKDTFRIVTRGTDGMLHIRDYNKQESLLRVHTQIGVDDCSTDLGLRGLPVLRGLIGPMPEGQERHSL